MRFEFCFWKDLTAIGNLVSLEILRLSGEPVVVPEEIGQLTNLIVLDLSHCWKLRHISPGVISSLTKLEELYLPRRVLWEGGGNEEGSYPSLRELEALSNLRTLYIEVEAPTVLPKTLLIRNLKKYRIFIGDSSWFSFEGYEKTFTMSLWIDIPLKREFQFLLYNSDAVGLRGPFVKDMALEFLREGSQTIVKVLIIRDIDCIGQGDVMDCTVAPSLLCTLETLQLRNVHAIQHICSSPLVAGVFAKLKELSIIRCDALENIFQLSSSTAEAEIVHLRSPVNTLGEVTATRNKLNFPQLQDLRISFLPKVVSFCIGIDEIQFSQLRNLYIGKLQRVECLISSSSSDQFSDPDENSIISFFPHKVSFPSLVGMDLSLLKNMKEIWCGQLQAGSFRNLARLYVSSCNSLQHVFSPWMARYLVHLHTLHIQDCWSLKGVVCAEKEGDGQEEFTSSILPELKKIKFDYLPAIESFCHIAHDLEFPMLEDVLIEFCPELKTFAPGFVHTPNLNHVDTSTYAGLWKGDLNGTIQHLYEDQKQR